MTLEVRANNTTVALASGARITGGAWHHILAEFARDSGTGTIFTDGVVTAAGPLTLPAGASLANDADLIVGMGSTGEYFSGAFEFLRIARSTLAQSRTSIEELYDWEFDGPFLRDFTGRESPGNDRYAGALNLDTP